MASVFKLTAPAVISFVNNDFSSPIGSDVTMVISSGLWMDAVDITILAPMSVQCKAKTGELSLQIKRTFCEKCVVLLLKLILCFNFRSIIIYGICDFANPSQLPCHYIKSPVTATRGDKSQHPLCRRRENIIAFQVEIMNGEMLSTMSYSPLPHNAYQLLYNPALMEYDYG